MDIHNYIVFNSLLWDRHLLLWKCNIATFNELLKQYYYEVFFLSEEKKKRLVFFPLKKSLLFFIDGCIICKIRFILWWFYEYYHDYCIVYINNFLCLISSCRDTNIAFCVLQFVEWILFLICVLSLNFLIWKQ